jgi:hypothetical protein
MSALDRQVCFRIAESEPADRPPRPPVLRDGCAEALSELLQMLACGEESAAIAFAGLGDSPVDDDGRLGLMRIAREELGHEALLRGLRCALPPPTRDGELRRTMARFYHGVARSDVGLHLAAIASLDSAVCAILSALLRPGGPIARDPAVFSVFRRIRTDEAGHVRVARRIAATFLGADEIAAVAETTRAELVGMLSLRGAALEVLGVDAGRLFAGLRRVPEGILR